MNSKAILVILSCIAIPSLNTVEAAPGVQILDLPMQGYAGHFREHCMYLRAGRTLTLTIRSPYKVRLNVHHHAATSTVFLFDEIIQRSTPNAVVITSDGEHCVEVRNPENRVSPFDLRLEYRVSAD